MAIEEEFAEHGTDEDKRYLTYVLHEPVAHHEGLYDPARAGKMLSYFVDHPISKQAGLEDVHVVALRLYTSQAFVSLNAPLRRGEKHPFAATVGFVTEGIKRLRGIHVDERAPVSVRLWRGLRNVRGELLARSGGTEQAMLSCTPDLATAARFSTSRVALLFLVTAKTFMQCGATLDFLSCMPHEHEVCYPPSTYLKPTGRTQLVDLCDGIQCMVVEVIPYVGG